MNRSVSILYIAVAPEGYTSLQRARALERLGHRVTIINLHYCLPRSIWWRRLNNYTGGLLSQPWVLSFLRRELPNQRFDVAWVDSGQAVGASVIALLRTCATRVVNYNNDDPTGSRDGRAWILFRRAARRYDLLITMRKQTESELLQIGGRAVFRVKMSFDEVAHRPRALSDRDWLQWRSQVVFIGSWMPERGPFLCRLIELGVPLSIIGDHWQKAPEIELLRPFLRSGAVYGDNYAKAIQCSKIALGLLSKGNRDLHTQRSTEVPALGGLLCAERTSEHLEMFREGEEAVFWSDAGECAVSCFELLRDEHRRSKIARSGQDAVWGRGFGNEAVLAQVLARIHQIV